MIHVLASAPSQGSYGNLAGAVIWVFLIFILVGAIQERRR